MKTTLIISSLLLFFTCDSFSQEQKVTVKKDLISVDGSAYWLKATKANNYRLLLKSTAVFGGTMFFGKNTGDPRNADYNWKYLSIF